MVRSRRLGANAWAEQKKKVQRLKNPGGYMANSRPKVHHAQRVLLIPPYGLFGGKSFSLNLFVSTEHSFIIISRVIVK